jgi:type IV pilus assembly protein PilE
MHPSPSRPHLAPRAQRGLTLIEIMLVLAIIGVVSGLALSKYQSDVIKNRRYAAQACLMEYVQYVERYRASNFVYPAASRLLPVIQCRTDLNPYYGFSIDSHQYNPYDFSPVFTLFASVQSATLDVTCHDMMVNQAGVKTSRDYYSRATTGCWP